MSAVLTGDVQKDKTESNLNWVLWIQHAQRIVYFSPMEGYEKKNFKAREN